jgi:predicted nucleic acid-binding protein
MEWVLDASVTMTWCFESERTAYTEGLLDRAGSSPSVVPQVWAWEVANVLVLALRRKRIDRTQRNRFLSMLETLLIHADDLKGLKVFAPVLAVAEEYGLTAYDASYLELSLRMGLPLATMDTQLQAAARKAGVVLL